MNSKTTIAVVVGAMLVEGLVAYAMWPKAEAAAPQEEKQERRHRTRDVQEGADVRQMRQRIRELEQRLAAAKIEVPPATEAKVEENGERRRERGGERFGMQDIRERMERFAKDDPERFAQMTNGMAQGMRRMQERQQAKVNFLSAINTSKMTAQQKEVHGKYLDLLARQDELQGYLRPDANVTDEERQAALDEMRELGHNLRDLGHAERDTLLAQAAQNMGYAPEEAETVVGQIKEIFQVTDGDRGFGAFGGGPGGPGGNWGGRGGNGGGRGGNGGGRGGNGGGRGNWGGRGGRGGNGGGR